MKTRVSLTRNESVYRRRLRGSTDLALWIAAMQARDAIAV